MCRSRTQPATTGTRVRPGHCALVRRRGCGSATPCARQSLSIGWLHSNVRALMGRGLLANPARQPVRSHSKRPRPANAVQLNTPSSVGSLTTPLRPNAQPTWYNSTRLAAWVHSQRLRPNAQPTWYNSTRLVAWVHSQRPAGVLLHSPGSIQGFPKIGHIPSNQSAKKTNCGSKRSPAAFHHGNLSQSRVGTLGHQ